MSYIYWNVSPELISLGPFTVRWYGLFFALAFFAGYQIVRWVFIRENKPEQDLDRLLLYLVFGTVIGARLGHCLFYDPVYYLGNPVEILKIWEGGLASHGGAAGILTALYLYARNHHDQPYIWLLDRVSIPSALGGGLVRIGNLFNSEIVGVPAEAPWAFVFARIDSIPRHPVQLYESGAYGLIFLLLFGLYRWRGADIKPGLLFGLYLVCTFTARFLIEFFKVRQAAYGLDLPLSVGQLLSIPMVMAGLTLLLWRSKKRP